jgi:colanic acid/amylovoran biosynthesis glycosyltransferase
MVLLYSALPWLRQRPYDVIHCHFAPSGVMAVLLREIGALQGTIITTFHGYDVGSYPQKHGINVYEPLFRMGDLYTANTRYTRDRGIALGCPSERIVTLPMGIDLSKFRFTPRQLLPGEPIKILTVGRLVEKKGIEYAVRAVAKVTHAERRIVYRIAGDGPLRGALERLISGLHLDARVQLIGAKTKDEVRDLYADSHLFMLSSVTAADGDKEGQGLVLQEAQATGLPVLSTLHNGIPDGVRDGESGFLVPERDVDALAGRLSELVEHPERWSAMGRAGRAHMEAHYDVERLTDRLVEIYRSLVAGAGTATGSAIRAPSLDGVREKAERSA